MYFSRVRLITLTTDFGLDDWFVGAMKGVILGRAPDATIVDLTHDVPRGDAGAGAFALAAGCRFFPRRTVHVAVVDPGVGSARRAIAVQTADYFFVGPDNGVLSLALAREKIKAIRRLENSEFLLCDVSRTFHGRDVFAPVAAALCTGTPIQKLGPASADYVRLPWPEPKPSQAGIRGAVVYVDRFGNAITSIPAEMMKRFGGRANISVGTRPFGELKHFYQAVGPGRSVALVGSSGFLELAVNGGSAAKKFKLRRGVAVMVRPAK